MDRKGRCYLIMLTFRSRFGHGLDTRFHRSMHCWSRPGGDALLVSLSCVGAETPSPPLPLSPSPIPWVGGRRRGREGMGSGGRYCHCCLGALVLCRTNWHCSNLRLWWHFQQCAFLWFQMTKSELKWLLEEVNDDGHKGWRWSETSKETQSNRMFHS